MERRTAETANDAEGVVSDARAEGKIEIGGVAETGQDAREVVGAERFQGSAVLGLELVKPFASKREGFEIGRVGRDEVKDDEDELF